MANLDMSALQTLLMSWGLKIISALAILLVGMWLASRLANIVARMMGRHKVELTLTKFLRNVIYYAILAAVLIAAAGQLGINTASFITIVGAAGLAVGLALKDSLANFSSGVMLILFRPFRVGDAVTIAGETGAVDEITIFNTILNTPDNQRKIIPNGKISNDIITNITANPTRRIDLVIGVSYDDDIRVASGILERIVLEESRILAEPPAQIAVSELADSSVNFVVRPWVKTTDYWNVRCALVQKIKLSFDEEGITIPFPQRDIHLYQVDQTANTSQE